MTKLVRIALNTAGGVVLGMGLLANIPKAHAALINGGFETPVVPSNLEWKNFNEADVPGWETTATDSLIEIQTRRLFHPGALNTDQYSELNANQVSTLFQDVGTTSGSTTYWRFFHRGRQGVDTLRLSIIDLGTNTTLFSEQYSTGNTAWAEYSGQTVVTGSNTRWQFESVSAAGGNPTVGNFLDEVYFAQTPPPSVPEPLTLGGIAIAGAFGTWMKLKQKTATA